MVRERFPDVRLIENARNLGFARAANQGIEASWGKYIALVNSDTMLSPGSLAGMTKFIDGHRDVGAVGCQLLWQSGKMQYSGGSAPTIGAALRQLLMLPNITGGRLTGVFMNVRDNGEAQEVDWVCAACMVVSREAVDNVGPLTEQRFMYAEDIDWGLRMKAAGWKVMLLPWIRVVHYGGASGSWQTGGGHTAWLEGLFDVARDNHQAGGYTVFGLLMSASFAIKTVVYSLVSLARGGRGSMAARAAAQRNYLNTSLALTMRRPAAKK